MSIGDSHGKTRQEAMKEKYYIFYKCVCWYFLREMRVFGNNMVWSAVCVNVVLAVSVHTLKDNKFGAISAKASYG